MEAENAATVGGAVGMHTNVHPVRMNPGETCPCQQRFRGGKGRCTLDAKAMAGAYSSGTYKAQDGKDRRLWYRKYQCALRHTFEVSWTSTIEI